MTAQDRHEISEANRALLRAGGGRPMSFHAKGLPDSNAAQRCAGSRPKRSRPRAGSLPAGTQRFDCDESRRSDASTIPVRASGLLESRARGSTSDGSTVPTPSGAMERRDLKGRVSAVGQGRVLLFVGRGHQRAHDLLVGDQPPPRRRARLAQPRAPGMRLSARPRPKLGLAFVNIPPCVRFLRQ